ncbi:MAG: outer membrane beta-barrel protein [Bacteroidetes bacterium]|nr:outer membrane beta-barrel protein [Bacteroidota bacterium]
MQRGLLILCFVAISQATYNSDTVQAQDVKGQMVGTIGIGFTRLDPNGYSKSDESSKSTPVFHFEFDRAFTHSISGGLAFTFQRVSSVDKEVIPGRVIDLKTSITLTDVSIRGLYHWSTDPRLDFYIGLRLGYMMFIYNYDNDKFVPEESTDSEEGDETKNKVTIAPTVGLRYFFNESIAAGVELDVTIYPYIFGLGISYRFE